MVWLWRLTLAVGVILLIFTLMLVVKFRAFPSADFTGYITGQGAIVYLRNRPADSGKIISILNPGSAVHVDRSTTTMDITWYHIRSESGSGWIPETNLNLIKP